MSYKVENPKLFPAYVMVRSPDERTARLRGEIFFETVAQQGLRVQFVDGSEEPGSEEMIGIMRPWTYVFMPVPFVDAGPRFDGLEELACSVIIDVHFPIMNRGEIRSGGRFSVEEVWARRGIMLANLARADAVTVSQPGWAADLAEVNPNVFYLPDLDLPEECYLDELSDGFAGSDRSTSAVKAVNEFAARFAEIAAVSARHKVRRRRELAR